jgi:hypothetical protein
MWVHGQVKVMPCPKQRESFVRFKSWAILGSDGHTICSKHNIGGDGCNCKFKNLFIGVWCVTKFKYLSIYLHLTYNPYQSWGLGTDGVWILPNH